MGVPQSILILGGSSEIGLAVADHFATLGASRISLAGRPSDRLDAAAERLRARGCDVSTYTFDALDPESHAGLIEEISGKGDIDIALVAFGILGKQQEAEQNGMAAVHIAETNYVGAVSVGVELQKAMRSQGHGVIVALSSVAGERPRRANFIYGSSKAGMDAFFTGLGDALAGSGVRVVVVRPGFVRTRMTAEQEVRALSTTPEAVAEAVADAIRDRSETIWVPSQLRYLMAAIRHLPRPLFRRIRI